MPLLTTLRPKLMTLLSAAVLVILIGNSLVQATPGVARRSLSTTVPIKRALSGKLSKRGTQSGAIGLGDFADK